MNKSYEDLLLEEIKELLKKLPPNIRIRVYYDSKGREKRRMKKVNKTTISQRMDKIDYTLMLINQHLIALKQDVINLKQDVKNINVRLDNIEKRLDYNNLKQLPNATNR